MQEKKGKGSKDAQSPTKSSSLFQRVFHRSKSQSELAQCGSDGNANPAELAAGGAAAAPPVPQHQSNLDLSLSTRHSVVAPAVSANETSLDSLNGNEPTEADLSDLQDFLDSGNLDHLDNMVSEFAKQYLPETGEGQAATASGAASGENNNVQAAPQAAAGKS